MKRNRRAQPRTCQGKSCYESHGVALEVIRVRQQDNPTLYLRAYRCPECGLHHITHLPDRFRKDDAA